MSDSHGSNPGHASGKKPVTTTKTPAASKSGSISKGAPATKLPSLSPKAAAAKPAASSSQAKNDLAASANSNTEKVDNNNEDQNEIKEEKPERCAICLDDCTEPKQLNKCGHIFCTACIDQYFHTVKPQCPCCFTIYGEIRGNQPDNGIMAYNIVKHRLPGFKNNSSGTIHITYEFPSGIQDDRHPNPGMRYHGTRREAYLPDNPEGHHVLKLLQRAFDLRQIFTVGQSRTTGSENVVTWNDIHHKTNINGGMEHFGYPDKTYLNRVQQELAAKGIK